MGMSVHSVRHQAGPRGARYISSFFLGVEVTQRQSRFACADAGAPLAAVLCPRHTAIPRCRTFETGQVLTVFWTNGHSQVAEPVIEPVAVDVIALKAIAIDQSKQSTMEFDRATPACRVGASDSVAIAVETPAPLTYPFRIVSINGGVGADRAITGVKRNRCRSVIVHCRRNDRIGASARAVVPLFDPRRLAVEHSAARRTATLNLHRDLPLNRNRGAGPGSVDADAGAISCLDFTTLVRAV